MPVFYSFLLLKPKTPKYLPLSVCSPFLIQCHLSTPSAPRGIDTLIYRKATIDPLDLWVIKNRLLARLTGKATQLNLLTSPSSPPSGPKNGRRHYCRGDQLRPRPSLPRLQINAGGAHHSNGTNGVSNGAPRRAHGQCPAISASPLTSFAADLWAPSIKKVTSE